LPVEISQFFSVQLDECGGQTANAAQRHAKVVQGIHRAGQNGPFIFQHNGALFGQQSAKDCCGTFRRTSRTGCWD